jgi:hypothetical protein
VRVALARRRALVGREQVARLGAVHVHLGRPDDPPARRAHRHRLVLDHRAQPRRGGRGVHRVGPAQEDLQRPLVGVMSVVGAQRVPPRHRQQGAGVRADDREHQLAPGLRG